MFKDYDKYLSTSLKAYLFVLVIIFILKLVGLDYFGLDVNNPFMIKLNKFVLNFKIKEIWYCFTLWLYAYLIIAISTNKKNVKVVALITTAINVISILTIKYYMIKPLRSLFDIILLYLPCLIINRKEIKITLKRTTICIFAYTLFQCISMITRKGDMQIVQEDFISLFILNFDYILMMLITYKIYFMRGGTDLCGMAEAGLSLQKKINLKNLLKKSQRNLHNFKSKDKVEKLSLIIYVIFSLIWNLLSLAIILIVSQLNHTFIECLFILTSFWLSKKVFGKAFHLSSMIQCFIVSNLTYYALNRITTPLGISIFIPILLGVGLSYFTSKLVKKTYKPLYKGMPKDIFEETILKITDKGSIKYKVCYDFYILRENDLSLSFKYNYSIAGIRKIKDRINDKIKELK